MGLADDVRRQRDLQAEQARRDECELSTREQAAREYLRRLNRLVPEFVSAAKELGVSGEGVLGRSWVVHAMPPLNLRLTIKPSGSWQFQQSGGGGGKASAKHVDNELSKMESYPDDAAIRNIFREWLANPTRTQYGSSRD